MTRARSSAFKSGKLAFAADAAVEIVKAGAQASKGFGATSSIYVFAEGGMLLDLAIGGQKFMAIGGQKFIFKPAALGRMRTAKGGLEEEAAPEGGEARKREETDTERAAAAEKEGPGAHAR